MLRILNTDDELLHVARVLLSSNRFALMFGINYFVFFCHFRSIERLRDSRFNPTLDAPCDKLRFENLIVVYCLRKACI